LRHTYEDVIEASIPVVAKIAVCPSRTFIGWRRGWVMGEDARGVVEFESLEDGTLEILSRLYVRLPTTFNRQMATSAHHHRISAIRVKHTAMS
jgi:hypothetical protein